MLWVLWDFGAHYCCCSSCRRSLHFADSAASNPSVEPMLGGYYGQKLAWDLPEAVAVVAVAVAVAVAAAAAAVVVVAAAAAAAVV